MELNPGFEIIFLEWPKSLQLEWPRMLACKPVETPIEMYHKLGEYTDQRIAGRLVYWSHTRPDIINVASVVNQFMHASNEEHMNAIHRI